MGTARAVELWISVIKENFKTQRLIEVMFAIKRDLLGFIGSC